LNTVSGTLYMTAVSDLQPLNAASFYAMPPLESLLFCNY